MATPEEATAIQQAIDAAKKAFEDFKQYVNDEVQKLSASLQQANSNSPAEVDLTPQVQAADALATEIQAAVNPVDQVPAVPATDPTAGGDAQATTATPAPGAAVPGPGEAVGPGAPVQPTAPGEAPAEPAPSGDQPQSDATSGGEQAGTSQTG